jgi:CDP-diglyceride synthetase
MKLLFVFGFIFFFLGMFLFMTGVHNEDLSHNMLVLSERYDLDLHDVGILGNNIDYGESYRMATIFELLGLVFCVAGSLCLGYLNYEINNKQHGY